MNGDHPAAHLRASFAVLRRRSWLAIFALGATAIARAWTVLALQWSLGFIEAIPTDGEPATPDLMERLHTADRLVNAGTVAIGITYVVTAVLFLRWTHRLFFFARELGASTLEPATAVSSFLVPIMMLFRPYQHFTKLHDSLAPELVAPPAVRVAPSEVGYRSVSFATPSPARPMPRTWVGAWWGGFLIMNLCGQFIRMGKHATTPAEVIASYEGESLIGVVAVIAAALAATVVRGMTARAEERFRRICASTPEELAEQEIVIA